MTVDIEKLEALAKAVLDDPSDWQPTQAAWEYHQALKDPGVVLELIAELKCPIRLARHSKRLIEDLRAELAGLKTGYEAYERVNAELRAEIDRLNDEYDKAWRHDLNDKNNVQALAAEVARLSAECEALRKDAEKYQFLRDKNEFSECSFLVIDVDSGDSIESMDWLSGNLLDTRMDEVMSAEADNVKDKKNG